MGTHFRAIVNEGMTDLHASLLVGVEQNKDCPGAANFGQTARYEASRLEQNEAGSIEIVDTV